MEAPSVDNLHVVDGDSVKQSNYKKYCSIALLAITLGVVIIMEVSLGVNADNMFKEQKVGQMGTNGRLIHRCNASLVEDDYSCAYCFCDRTNRCHKLTYDLQLISNGTVTSNSWTWGCHCATYEGIVYEGTMRCTVDKNGLLHGYGREAYYKIGVITCFVVFPLGFLIFGLCLQRLIWCPTRRRRYA